MAPLKCFAWVAFALNEMALFSRAADAPTAAGVTDSCLLGLNLLRTARLSVRLNELKKDTATETAAATAITTEKLAGDDNANCALAADTKPVTNTVLGMLLTYNQDTAFDCTALLQAELNTAIATLGNYNGAAWNNGAAAPYDTTPVQNLAYAAFATATSVGCGGTNNCKAGVNVVVCRFTPSLTQAYTEAPFTTDFFKALEDRKKAGVDLTKLTANDLNTSPSGGGGGGGGTGGVPGVVPASSGLILITLFGLVSSHT